MAAPRKTVAELLVDVRTNLDEDVASFWSDTQLIAALAAAQDLVWATVKSLKAGYFDIQRASTDGTVTVLGASFDTSTFAIAASGTSITLPPDVAEIEMIECITTDYEHVSFVFRPVTHPDFRAARRIVDAQDPTTILVAQIGERTLLTAPKINRALNIRLTYTPILDTLSAITDTLQVPHPLWLAVVDMATSRAQMKDRDPSFVMWKQAGQETIQRMFSGHSRQNQDIEVAQGVFE